MNRFRYISVLAIAIAVVLLTPRTAVAKKIYIPLYEVLKYGEVIVVGKVIKVDDPAWEDLQKPLANRYHVHGVTNGARATGHLRVERVIKGRVETGQVLLLQFPSAAPSRYWCCPSPPRYRQGDEGVWLLRRLPGGKCAGSLYNRNLAEAVQVMLKVRQGKEPAEKYMTCGNAAVWACLFENIFWRENFKRAAVLRWLACLPVVARGDNVEALLDVLFKCNFLCHVGELDRADALYVIIIMLCAAEASCEKAGAQDAAEAGREAYNTARYFAYMAAMLLRDKFGFRGPEPLVKMFDRDLGSGKGFPCCRKHLNNVFGLIDGPAARRARADRLKSLVKQLSSEKWRLRERAHAKILEMLRERRDSAPVDMLRSALEAGDIEQKYRIERILSHLPERIGELPWRHEPLANLALLLHSNITVRQEAVERLEDNFKLVDSVLDATLAERTKFVLEALDKLMPGEKKGK